MRQVPCHSKQTSDGDLTLCATAPEADLAPLHGTAQRPFGDVIGRLDAFVAEKSEESFEVLQQSQRQIGNLFVTAVEIAVRQGEELLLQRNRFGNQLLACDRAVANAGSISKTMP